jgi:hypothetical protein
VGGGGESFNLTVFLKVTETAIRGGIQLVNPCTLRRPCSGKNKSNTLEM